MSLLLGALTLGLILSFLALGIYISFRIFDFPDITAEGSYTLGAAFAAVLLTREAGFSPALAVLAAFAAGALAGMLTGILHTAFGINKLLSGILVMTGLYTVNLRIMGRSNVPLMECPTYMNYVKSAMEYLSIDSGFANKWTFGYGEYVWELTPRDLVELGFMALLVGVLCILFYWFFRTNFGTAMRATGDNDQMIRALGVNTNLMIILGLGLSNGLIALSGALFAQSNGFADVGMGIGIVVAGLASVIIGEALVRSRSLGLTIIGAVMGSVLYRLLVALALRAELDPNDLKLITATFVFVALVLPAFFSRWKRMVARKDGAAC